MHHLSHQVDGLPTFGSSDPNEISDRVSRDDPHPYFARMAHVFVNGSQVLVDGESTGRHGEGGLGRFAGQVGPYV